MVSAWVLAGALAAMSPGWAAAEVPAPPAPPAAAALDGWEREDAIDEGPDEAAFLDEAAPAAAPAPAVEGGAWTRGRLLVAGGGRSLRAQVGAGALRGDLLLAREAGELRTVDDAYAALTLAPRAGGLARAGWFEPRAGAGLVLGPRRVALAAPVPAESAPPIFAAPLSAVPARAAAGWRGLALERAFGGWRAGALAAWTPREARASGAALRPLLGVRHRTPAEEERRGRLHERTLGLVLARAAAGATVRTWLVALVTRTDPRRAPYDGSAAAAESAATTGRGGPAGELGAAWRAPGGGATLEGALALDAGGRARTRFAATARRGPTRAAFAFEGEARGFVPPRALPERRPRAQAVARLERRARVPWSLEARAAERPPGDPPRLSLALAVAPRRALRLEARHDGDPRRTRLAIRVAEPRGEVARLQGSAGAEVRFDPAGVARRTGWCAVAGALPGGLRFRLESRLGGGRRGAGGLDEDVPGGAWVRPGSGAARTRVELGRPGGLAPRLAWVRTTTADGHSDEVRLALQWAAGP